MVELTKKEKKLARELMDRSIEAEFETALNEAEQIMQQWKENALTGRLAFHKLRDHLNDYRKYLARRYDDLRSSDYLRVVAAILDDGYVSDEDIQEISDESKDEIGRWIKVWKSNE